MRYQSHRRDRWNNDEGHLQSVGGPWCYLRLSMGGRLTIPWHHFLYMAVCSLLFVWLFHVSIVVGSYMRLP